MQLQNTCQIPLISLGSGDKFRILGNRQESEDPSKVNMRQGYKSTAEDNPAINQPGSQKAHKSKGTEEGEAGTDTLGRIDQANLEPDLSTKTSFPEERK